jgi:ribosome-associated protein
LWPSAGITGLLDREGIGMIQITSTIAIHESELEFDFIRASGPGGQNVNKVATAVQLRFNVAGSPSLEETVRQRVTQLAGGRINKNGVLVINAARHRTQERNREDAIGRLVALIREAAKEPKQRRETKPPKALKERRLEDKRRRKDVKRTRKPITGEEE